MAHRFEVRSANPKMPPWVSHDLNEAKREADRLAAVGQCRIVIREMHDGQLLALYVRTTEGRFTEFDVY